MSYTETDHTKAENTMRYITSYRVVIVTIWRGTSRRVASIRTQITLHLALAKVGIGTLPIFDTTIGLLIFTT